MRNILVTGGCGFIGSHFIRYFISKYNYRIFNVDCLTYAGNLKNVESVSTRANYKFFQTNICSDEIAEVMKDCKIDTVVSFAAQSHVDRSIRYPKEFIDTDVYGSFNLAHAGLKIKLEKYLHISTDEVFGPIDPDFEANEMTPLAPTSPYAASKASGELLLMSYYKTYDLPLIVVRPCNTYGSHQYPEKLIPLTVTRLLSGNTALVHGEGTEQREWIYVDDLCRALDCALHKGKIGNIYNIGSGFRLSNIEVTKKILDIMDLPYTRIEYMANRPGNDTAYRINSNKMKKLYGDSYVTTGFYLGLRKAVEWYSRNQDWYSNVNIDANIYKSNEGYLR